MIKKYPMKNNTEKPGFQFLVKNSKSHMYLLYQTFNEAIRAAIEMSPPDEYEDILIYEPWLNKTTGRYYAKNTFSVIDGEILYNKHARPETYMESLINSGEWINPE